MNKVIIEMNQKYVKIILISIISKITGIAVISKISLRSIGLHSAHTKRKVHPNIKKAPVPVWYLYEISVLTFGLRMKTQIRWK